MLSLYQEIFFPLSHRVGEKRAGYFSLSERHLQILWLEQKFFTSLVTAQGEMIEVISPGIWNREAGPDFIKAHLRIGQQSYRGDVEIHFQDEGWYQHGHHKDLRYNQVILHLSFWPSTQQIPINKENGQQVLTCYLEQSLKLSPQSLVSLIDFDLYPSQKHRGSGRCAKHIFQKIDEKQIRWFLQSAAYWRLEKKLSLFEQYVESRSLQFAGGVAMALGYKHNSIAFLELFLYLFAYRELPYLELLAIAFGCCGFLEEGRKPAWNQSPYYQQLCSLWWGKRSQMTHQAHLKLHRIRPLHHPLRRLAYLVHFLQDARLENLWSAVLKRWEEFVYNPSTGFTYLKEKLLQLIPLYSDSYWDYHFTFEQSEQSKPLPSLGDDLKMQILLNTYLPLLYATLREAGNQQQWLLFQEFYASLETGQTSKSRYLHQHFFGDQKEEEFLNEAQMAQGAYQLHQDFCVHFEASCEGCPFIERYQLTLKSLII